ncbi:hypothetical protein B0O99DRAFT_616642, partial [Bisporella sp. PMI_857]
MGVVRGSIPRESRKIVKIGHYTPLFVILLMLMEDLWAGLLSVFAFAIMLESERLGVPRKLNIVDPKWIAGCC